MAKEEFLTVDEVADLLRIHRNTVYRWCREGQLKALRFGKGWRVPRTALENMGPSREAVEQSKPLEKIWPPGPLVQDWCVGGDHVMGIVESQEDVYHLEAAYLREGLPLNVRLFKGCWWQQPDDVRMELASRGLDVEDLESRRKLVIANLQDVCERGGPEAAVSVWVNETLQARHDGFERLWGCGSPYLAESPEAHERLRAFETLLSHRLNGLPVIGLCTYYLDTHIPNFLSKLIHLMRNHWGILTYTDPDNLAFARLKAE